MEVTDTPTRRVAPRSAAAQQRMRDALPSATLSCSSHKPGHPAARVLVPGDDYWQSDALLPHWLQACWPRPAHLCALEIGLDPGRDESYTPARVVVLAGDDAGHLFEVAAADVPEDIGATDEDVMTVDLREANDGRPVVARVLRVLMTANFSNGKDSRVRRMRALVSPECGPCVDPFSPFKSSLF